MSNFTLDYFLAQLLRYVEKNKDELEAMPTRVYSVASDHADAIGGGFYKDRPGAVFFLRQHNAA